MSAPGLWFSSGTDAKGARKLQTDDDEQRFKERLGKLVKRKPVEKDGLSQRTVRRALNPPVPRSHLADLKPVQRAESEAHLTHMHGGGSSGALETWFGRRQAPAPRQLPV